ncbi:response regulator [Sphingosinithalassobacter portus]|uniref:response regulator n=1 Tax=Stakelama portus TaxID=2676234 RepID=UPI000D6E546F|nr:response regulator [Sphingosinithalassobacter portus]
MRQSDAQIRQTHDVLTMLDEVLTSALDAETGQRGYLLTGEEAYLEPYVDGVADLRRRLELLERDTQGDSLRSETFEKLRSAVEIKLREMARVIELRRERGLEAAIAEVSSDRGKAAMDAIRAQMAVLQRGELETRQVREAALEAASRQAVISAVTASLIGIALTVTIFILGLRTSRTRERQRWLQTAQVGLSEAMRGDKTVPQLASAILTFLAEVTHAHAGAMFKGEAGTFNRAATLGVPATADVPETFERGDGLLGKVARDGHATMLRDVPAGYLTIGSAFGSDVPRHLLIAPCQVDGIVNGVIELGFFDEIDDQVPELLESTAGAIGIALRSARFREKLQDALEETQRQAGELQAQSEELRVSNEELEEQGNALKESQARLELQQVELEQTNSQLEEQAQTLENQRDELVRAATTLQLKTRELEQASQYKSDFLANMSHELRTPLNSLLILSKLLADNPDRNLSEEQIKFARTIESSGNDLLTLINDILDLSKIEAGHVEIEAAPVATERLAADMRKLFEQLAKERGLDLDVTLAPGAPRSIETDRLRLEQVLKNLLSNAIKFTEQGRVGLSIGPVKGEMLELAVSDTGIGIPPQQRDAIFEAFQQADGTISRRFGGTGLGLSISRELVRLLGGSIRLESEVGKGSTFFVAIPLAYDPGKVAAREVVPQVPAAIMAPEKPLRDRTPGPAAPSSSVEDDRDALADGKRLLLVIEDDSTFASIICDLSREMGFQCIVAGTAQDAIDLAREYRPSAIVLDIGLPDQSGLTVLDRLKHQDETRHIPIHVVSGEDQGNTALALGAVGFLGKPAPREQLAEVLAGLQEKLSARMRRVLIVEDDSVQREAVGNLLRSQDVETVGVGTAAECLAELREGGYDCMVLDLSLPDASGFSLLETLSEDVHEPLPPVIVYTGRDLSADEEQRLRRYSSSIIIKGAKSPERLLDEVSLFLHRVVSELPPEQRQMIEKARHRDAALEGRRILIVEDDVRNVYSLTSVLEPRGALTRIARNGQEALDALAAAATDPDNAIDLVLMDVMMPVMDGLTAARTIRDDPQWRKLPIIMLTAKAMPDDQQKCIDAGANDYMAKPIDVDKLLSLVRVWMPR